MASSQVLEPTLLNALRRHWLVAGVTFLVVAAAAVGALLATAGTSHTAELSMLLEDPRESLLFQSASSQSRPSTDYFADQVDLLGTAELARRSVAAAREQDPDFPHGTQEFLARRTIQRPGDQALVTVRFTSGSPEAAVLGANAVAAAYEDLLASQSSDAFAERIAALDAEIDALQERVTNLEDRIDRADGDGEQAVLDRQLSELVSRVGTLAERRDALRVDARLASRGVRLVTPAIVAPDAALGGMRTLLAVGFVAVVAAVGVTYAYALRRRAFASAVEAGLALDAPVVGIVAEHDSDELRDLDVERHHRFVADVVGQWRERGGGAPVVVAVTAGQRGAGVTTAVAAMASVLAWRRHATAVVDADVEDRQLTRLLQPAAALDRAGLSDVVDGSVPAADAGVDAVPDFGAVRVVPRGSRRLVPGDARRLPAALAELAAARDVVLIDVPGGLPDRLAQALVAAADRVLAVVPHGSRMVDAERLRDLLGDLGVGCDGVIYNRAPAGRRGRRARRPPAAVAPAETPARAPGGADQFEWSES